MAILTSRSYAFRILGKDRNVSLLWDSAGNSCIRRGEKVARTRIAWLGKTVALLHVGNNRYLFFVERTAEEIRLIHNGELCRIEKPSQEAGRLFAVRSGQSRIRVQSQMPGLVVALHVRENQPIKEGETVLVIEAMKMQNPVKAPASGTVKKIFVSAGTSVESATPLIEIERTGRVKS